MIDQKNTSNPNQRKLTPKQEAARRRAQKRRRNQLLLIAALVVVTAAAVIGIAIAVSQPTNFEAIPGAVTADTRAFELGPADAKVTVEEFGDYQCPGCKQWHDNQQPQLINTYINAGKSVKFIFRPYPFLDARSASRESHLTAEGAYCAGDQKRFWDFHNALYNNQPKGENTNYWTDGRIKELAKVLQLDTAKFNSCYDSGTYRSRVNQDAQTAQNRGVSGTPTIFVNAKQLSSISFEDMQKAIEEALNTPTK